MAESGPPGPLDDAADCAVVFLHGQPGSADDWARVAELLPPNAQPVAFDRPGYQGTVHPPADIPTNARWVIDQLDSAGVDEAILVGHSYGGGVALSVAAHAPARVRALILVASVGPDCLDGWDALLAAPVIGPICALAAWWLTPWFARLRLALLRRRRGRPLAENEYVNWTVWATARHDHGSMWRTFLTEQRALMRGLTEISSALGDVRAPTVIIADPRDKMIPIGTARALHRRVAGSTLVLADEGGHHLPRRNPGLVAEQISHVIDSTRRNPMPGTAR